METSERRQSRTFAMPLAAVMASLFGVVAYTGQGNAAAMASANYAGLGAVASSRVCFGNQRRARKRDAWKRSNGRTGQRGRCR